MIANIDGYVADEPYPSAFQREFAPPWIDAVLRHRGLCPPRIERGPFRLLDLGCGDGLGLVALAAAHPEGEFLGIDAIPEHVDAGEAAARALGLGNIAFRCARFAEVTAPARPGFDYVTGQGLIAWISEENRRHVYRIAAEHLAPGGIACIGYNTLPGWRDMLAFQRLLRQLAEAHTGGAYERFIAALEQLRRISKIGAAGLSANVIAWIDAQLEKLPAHYFAHEYLNQYWEPLWSSVVMGEMGRHGFGYLGPCRVDRLREDFCLKQAQRAELDTIADPIARETAADIFVGCSFRVDLYGRAVPRSEAPQQARLDGWWAAMVAEGDALFNHATAAGTLRFDNAAAHAILAALGEGPATLRSVQERGNAGTAADVLNAADALFVSRQITPADPPAAAPRAEATNALFVERIAAGGSMDCQIGPHGAMPVPHAIVRDWAEGGARASAMLTRLAVDERALRRDGRVEARLDDSVAV